MSKERKKTGILEIDDLDLRSRSERGEFDHLEIRYIPQLKKVMKLYAEGKQAGLTGRKLEGWIREQYNKYLQTKQGIKAKYTPGSFNLREAIQLARWGERWGKLVKTIHER